jgi:hypothetical protein
MLAEINITNIRVRSLRQKTRLLKFFSMT